MKMDWLVPAIIALVLFGTWGAIVKYATGKIDVVPLMLFNTLSSLIIVAVIFGFMLYSKQAAAISREGIYIALFAGVVAILAVIFEATAFKLGSLAVIGPMISVGAAAISVLAGIFIFKEIITARIAFGILLALVAIYLLAAG